MFKAVCLIVAVPFLLIAGLAIEQDPVQEKQKPTIPSAEDLEKAKAEAILKREMAARVLSADEGTEAIIKAVYESLRGLPTDAPAFFVTTEQGQPQGGDLSPEQVQLILKSDIPFEAKKALLVLYGRNAYLHRKLESR